MINFDETKIKVFSINYPIFYQYFNSSFEYLHNYQNNNRLNQKFIKIFEL